MSFVDLSAVCGGGGSRRTTQRIFGNECRRYFGSAENYDESLLDQNEVYSFEGLEESGNARMLQEMTLRVFVYDGTLTFALRTDNNADAALRTDPKGDGARTVQTECRELALCRGAARTRSNSAAKLRKKFKRRLHCCNFSMKLCNFASFFRIDTNETSYLPIYFSRSAAAYWLGTGATDALVAQP